MQQSPINAVTSFTAEGEGANGKGRALKVINKKVRDHAYGCQLFVSFSPKVKKGEKYRLTMDVRADEKASYTTQAQTEPYKYLFYDFFGTITATTEWTTYTKVITVGENKAGAGTIAFNLGNTATTYYFDNIVVSKYNENGGRKTIEKTPEEKEEIISGAMKSWISAMMKHTPYVHAWDVVNEPLAWMTGAQPFKLKTGVGKNPDASHFYWQDYLGKDYAVKAFKWARKYGGGDDILFINDYNLARNLEKCRGIINYVNYIDSHGVKVDGIGTQMHISVNMDKQKIVEMFKLLANSGKLIRISELDIGVGVPTSEVTPELAKKQAEMYKFVVEKYFEIIPKDQRYGITDWSIIDRLSGWRAGESVGLWTQDYTRKRAYVGFVKGLIKGQDNAK